MTSGIPSLLPYHPDRARDLLDIVSALCDSPMRDLDLRPIERSSLACAAVIAGHTRGWHDAKIAENAGISRERVRQLRVGMGLQINRRRCAAIIPKCLLGLVPDVAIASAYRVSGAWIATLRLRQGIPAAPQRVDSRVDGVGAESYRLRTEGRSWHGIARAIGRDYGTNPLSMARKLALDWARRHGAAWPPPGAVNHNSRPKPRRLREGTIGQRAYETRLTGLTWAQVGQRIRPERPYHTDDALILARKYALSRGLPWPIPRTRTRS